MKKYLILTFFFLLSFTQVNASEKMSIEDFFKLYQKDNGVTKLESSAKDGFFKYIFSEMPKSIYDDNRSSAYFTFQNYESSETLSPELLNKMDFGNPNFPECKNSFKYGNKKQFIYQLVTCEKDIKLVRIITKDLLFSFETNSEYITFSKTDISTYMQYFLKNYKRLSYEKKTLELVKDENWVLIKMLPQIISRLDRGIFSYGFDKNKKIRFIGVYQENFIVTNDENFKVRQFELEIDSLVESIGPKNRDITLSFDGKNITFSIYKIGKGEETFNAPRKEGSYYDVYGKNIQREDILSFLEYIEKSYYFSE